MAWRPSLPGARRYVRDPRVALMGANSERTNNILTLRRPRGGRLEGWAAQEIAEKAVLPRPFCRRPRGEGYFAPIETQPFGPTLRVGFLCKSKRVVH